MFDSSLAVESLLGGWSSQMRELEIRSLDASEIPLAREMASRYPDFHACYVVERLPSFFAIVRELDPDSAYYRDQRLVAGAFIGGEMVGTVAVQQVADESPAERTEEDDRRFCESFTEHEANVYTTLQESLRKTIIGAPTGSLTIHSLAVSPEYRQQGIARSLIQFVIGSLTQNERLSLYIEFARFRWLRRFGSSLGFSTVRQTFSISERLEYGCWGSVLMQYQSATGR